MDKITNIVCSSIVTEHDVKLVAVKNSFQKEYNEVDEAEKIMRWLGNAIPYPVWIELRNIIMEKCGLIFKDKAEQKAHEVYMKTIRDLRISNIEKNLSKTQPIIKGKK